LDKFLINILNPFYEKHFAPPQNYKKGARFGLALIFGFSMLISSCIPEPESPTIEVSENSQLMKVREWFEENKTNLRLPERGSNYRADAQELILPFFEKEPDWDQFHHYYFPDGREVFEVSLENATKYFPKSMLDSFPNQNPADVVIQNIMFVKHKTAERFDPVIARYYPDDVASAKEFKNISYDGIPFDWSGIVDIWTYDERHFIGFIYEEGELINHFRFKPADSSGENRIAGDCRTVIREISNNYTGSNGVVVVMPSYLVAQTTCTGSGGYNPTGGQGTGDRGEYYDYERPTCCDDPITAPPRDLPDYDPPTIPSPATIINQLTNPCAIDIFKELSKGSRNLTDLSGLGGLDIFPGMLDLFQQSGKFDYRIQNGNIDPRLGGKTDPINGIMVITLSNDYLNKATSLSIARTIIHETVHAYLQKQLLRSTRTDLNIFELLQEYFKKYPDKGDYQHATMSQLLLGMTVSLYNWDKKSGPTGGSLPFDYYYKLSFGGLIKDGTTDLLEEAQQLIPAGSSWSEIEGVITNEATGNYQANGKKCN
jgi:hypothetical protein